MVTEIPIVIFTYNRPSNIYELIKSIKKNYSYKKYRYYFFCDGPKNEKDLEKCLKVQKIIKNFKVNKKKIYIRNKNIGLSRSVICGLDLIFKKNKYAIILEDDLFIAKNTFSFLVSMLKKYEKTDFIGSVSGYSYIHNIQNINDNLYLIPRHCSWGWGTWRSVWTKVKWNNYNIERKNFSNGGYDLSLLLKGQKKNYIDSWAIRFNLFCHNNNLLCLMPRYSFIDNLGFGKNATHTKNYFFNRKNLILKKINLKKILNQLPVSNK
ncbi:glycosyltransferase, partial [Candidatus Pelagibacter ubique]|nr:glycosyltransferase [Candidatus Pelagibacter ubique]